MQLNYNPSEIFNGVEYQKSYPKTAQTCPLTHFLRYGISHYYCIAQKNPEFLKDLSDIAKINTTEEGKKMEKLLQEEAIKIVNKKMGKEQE